MRTRRLVAATLVWIAAVGGALILALVASATPYVRLSSDLVFAGALLAVLGLAAVAAYGWLWRPAPEELARRLDSDLGLEDRVASALAALGSSSASPLAPLVVQDAADAVEVALGTDAAPLRRALPLAPTRRVWRWAVRAAFLAVSVVAAVLILRAVPELPPGAFQWIGIRPGASETEAGDEESDEETPDAAGEPETDPDSDEKPKGPGAEEDVAPEVPDEPEPVPPEPAAVEPARVRVRFARDAYKAGEPIPAVISAVPTGEAGLPPMYRVDLEVDGVRTPTALRLTVSREVPEGVAEAIDLRTLPRLWPNLEGGTHEAIAHLVPLGRDTSVTGDPVTSEPQEFRVEGDPGGGGGSSPDPDPEPQEQPQDSPNPDPEQSPEGAPPPQEPPPLTGGTGEGDGEPPPPHASLPPPPERERVAVLPLFGEGDEVEKLGDVLVLEPGGGEGSAVEPKPLSVALPAARRRAETQLSRAGVRPGDRELLRRYFDALARRLR